MRLTRRSDTTSLVSRPSVEEHRDVNSSFNVSSPSQPPPPRHSRAMSPLRSKSFWTPILLLPSYSYAWSGSVTSGAHDDCDDLIPTKSIKNAQSFIVDTLPRQVYLNFLLYLPAMYFSRVARTFEDAEVSKQEIVEAEVRR
jgi:hypothetical protein